MRIAALVLLLYWPAVALAQDHVLLAEVMPELAGSKLGNVKVAPAPTTGAKLTIRASDVRRALQRAKVSAEGLEIPRATPISRKLIKLPTESLLEEEHDALAQAASPCSVLDVQGPKEVSVTEGPRQTRVEVASERRTGRVTGSVIVTNGSREVRVPLVLKLLCPEPEVAPGRQVDLVVRVGNVRVSTLGEARQSGRIGDVIRVTSRVNGASLRARIIDAQTLEVVP